MDVRVRLTAKERKVLEALQSGLFLRQRQFSDLWEIARSMSKSILSERDRSDDLFSVNRNVIENLKRRRLIYTGDDHVYLRSRLMITDAGKQAISTKDDHDPAT